jgi:hypothetical protein
MLADLNRRGHNPQPSPQAFVRRSVPLPALARNFNIREQNIIAYLYYSTTLPVYQLHEIFYSLDTQEYLCYDNSDFTRLVRYKG